MYCSTCATPLQPGQKFCPSCGQTAVIAAIGRPESVRLAGNLLFAAIALSVLAAIYSWRLAGFERLFSVPLLVMPALLIVIWLVLIFQVLDGKNWARMG